MPRCHIKLKHASTAAPSDIFQLFEPSTAGPDGSQVLSSSSHRAVKYSRRFKLVFSLLNEDIGAGGFVNWNVQAGISGENCLALWLAGNAS